MAKDHTISITIDGEEFEVAKDDETARQLLVLASLDPGTTYLIELKGQGQQISFRDKADEEIHLHNHMHFISGDLGPSPVA